MTVPVRLLRFLPCVTLLLFALPDVSAQQNRYPIGNRRRLPVAPNPVRAYRPAAATPMRKPSDLIHRQEPIRINQELLAQLSPEKVHVVVALGKQRAFLMSGDEVVIDCPISSGKRGHSTPNGKFTVLEKDPHHRSNVYGAFCDRNNRIVRGGVSARIDSAPSGTHFVGAEMKWFMRLTGDGVGMHVGILPGYPASHGCVRMPEQGAELFYNYVKVGTPVDVQAPSPAG